MSFLRISSLVLAFSSSIVVPVASTTAGKAPSAAQAPPAAQASSAAGSAIEKIGRLGWLAGCWGRETASRTVEEQWMAPRGKSMVGMSRTVSRSDDRTMEFEAVRIEQREGHLVFTAKPSGQPEASFGSIELTDSLVTFENREHDFPQRVGYRLTPGGRLEAWIEGVKPGAKDSAILRIEFPYERVRCP